MSQYFEINFRSSSHICAKRTISSKRCNSELLVTLVAKDISSEHLTSSDPYESKDISEQATF
jgi:hypothetical protein